MKSKTAVLWFAALVFVSSPAWARDIPHEKGFSASLGITGNHLELTDATRRYLSAAGLYLDENGRGGQLRAGYRFNPYLSLDLRLSGSELDSGRDDVDAGFGMATVEVVGHLRPGKRVQPYLAGGVGGAAIVLDGGEFNEESLDAELMSLGGGVNVHISRRWVVGFDYRYHTFDFESEQIQRADRPSLPFDGSGDAHDVGFSWSFLF